MPEILEMSGLDDATPQRSGIGAILLVAGIAYALKLLSDLLGKDKPTVSGIGGLGIIKPCRDCDMKEGRAKSKQKWCLWDSKGNRILGRHPSKGSALRQEHLIQMKKHAR